GTGATSAEGARKNLELDNVATKSGGAVPVDQGGTGSRNPLGARNNLGLGSGDNVDFYRLNLSGPTRPQLNMQATSRTGIGAILRVEVPPESGTSPYFIQLASPSGAEGTILSLLPKTTGTLAVQGTSGREFKTDITPADNKEALSRVMSLEMVNFVYKDDEQQRLRFGIIAEDAEIPAPQYVKHYRYPVPGTEVLDDEGNIVSQEYEDRPAIDNNPIIMDLLGVAQYQQKMINDMAESIKTLESRLT
ncbi:tail fiber domain-containing protein, partial [Citrobacter freundii]